MWSGFMAPNQNGIITDYGASVVAHIVVPIERVSGHLDDGMIQPMSVLLLPDISEWSLGRAVMELQPISRPPAHRSVRRARLELGALSELELRAKSFWAGSGGLVITVIMGALIVALLVGWVLLWIPRGGGAGIVMLTLGSAAFAAVLSALILLLNRLRAQARLRQAEAAFLTGMSHNLRTPISAIRVAAQAIQNEGLESAQRAKLASAIVSETRRLGLRVANVLEAGRLEVEPLRFAPEAVDLVALVERSLSGVEELIKERDGSLSFEHPQAVWVHGDASASPWLSTT